MSETLVVIMHRHGHRAFGDFLADDVLVHEFLELARAGDGAEHRLAAGDFAFLLPEDVLAEFGTVGANVDVVGPFDHGADFAGAFSAEGTIGDLATPETASPRAAAARGGSGGRCGAAVAAISACLIRHELIPA